VKYLGWGIGPGSAFTYDTKVGELVFSDVTDEQWKLFRPGDRWVYENVRGLIAAGADPLKVAVERGRQLGLKVFARFQMNHEYGSPDPRHPGYWAFLGCNGRLTKEHPEYRIGRSVRLDFKHQEVRDFKLAIIREVAERGVDAVMLDFCVYPPFFAEPDAAVMTQFVRDARAVLDAAGASRSGRAAGPQRPELIVAVPDEWPVDLGLDWPAWMRQRLGDGVVPCRLLGAANTFDVNIDRFLATGRETGCKVWGFVWNTLAIGGGDPQPGDEKTGIVRYGKPKTREMFYAQALLYHRAGVDGLHVSSSGGLVWGRHPWFFDLVDLAKIEFADKHYLVDPRPHLPVRLRPPAKGPRTAEAAVPLRIGDDVARALTLGYDVKASLLVYSRGLRQGETLSLRINDHGPVSIAGGSPEEAQLEPPVDWRNPKDRTFIHQRDWWKRGQRRLTIDARWLQPGANTIGLVYRDESKRPAADLDVWWVELLLDYEQGARVDGQ